MESSIGKDSNERVPLSGVVADCVKRWFKDTLREAKGGDVNMQVLVGQMYYSGYGVPKDAQKVIRPTVPRSTEAPYQYCDPHFKYALELHGG